MTIVENQSASSGLSVALLCAALAVSRATFYRRDNEPAKKGPRARSPRALIPVERDAVLATLHSERFVDHAPAEVHAQLLDEGKYLCSTRTIYRILESNEEVRERRNQRRHPPHKKPELVATAPNQVWTWDITKLRGPGSTHYSLYVILDIFSRYVVGWLIAERESAELATRLIRETSERQGVAPGQVTIHADRGAPMTSDLVAALLARLSITKSHSRLRVSDDNPFSEAQFKTLKYNPWFPERFGSLDDARAFCQRFFAWYNTEHHHSGIAFLTPYEVHHGLAEATLAKRSAVLADAFAVRPERFPHGPRCRRRAPRRWPRSAPHRTPHVQALEHGAGHAGGLHPVLALVQARQAGLLEARAGREPRAGRAAVRVPKGPAHLDAHAALPVRRLAASSSGARASTGRSAFIP
jgi:putative transposase